MFIVDAKVTPGDQTRSLISVHEEFLNKKFDEGIFVMFGLNKTLEWHGTIIAKAESLETLQEHLAEDPLLKAGCVEYSIQEFHAARIAEHITE